MAEQWQDINASRRRAFLNTLFSVATTEARVFMMRKTSLHTLVGLKSIPQNLAWIYMLGF
jgi:hypothetical protein